MPITDMHIPSTPTYAFRALSIFCFIIVITCVLSFNHTHAQTVPDIIDVHTDGSITNIIATTTTDLGRGTALLYAVSQAQNGDSLYLSAETFDLGNNGIDLSMGGGQPNSLANGGSINLHGAGEYSTIIRSSLYTSSNNCTYQCYIVNTADNSDTSDLSIISYGTTTAYTYPWGSKFADAQGASLRNVFLSADVSGTDGVLLFDINTARHIRASVTISNITTSNVQDSIVTEWPGSTVNVYNSTLSTNSDYHYLDISYPNVLISSHTPDSAFIGATSTENIWDSTLTALPPVLTTPNHSSACIDAILNGDTTVFSGTGNYSTQLYLNQVTLNTPVCPYASYQLQTYVSQPGSPYHSAIWITSDSTYNSGKFSGGATTVVSPSATTTPSVQIFALPNSVTVNSATLIATLLLNGGATSTVEGFNYGTTTAYGTTISTTGSFATGDFTQSLSGLSCGTTYYYQAFATNSAGTSSSSAATFITSPCVL